jgi:hypothetical protein
MGHPRASVFGVHETTVTDTSAHYHPPMPVGVVQSRSAVAVAYHTVSVDPLRGANPRIKWFHPKLSF